MIPFEEGSVNFLSLLVILINFFAYLLIALLWIGKSSENKGNLFFSFLIFQYSLYFLPELLYLFGLLDDFPHVVRLYVVGSLLIGPFTYFYIRTCIEKDFKLHLKMGWHFLPAIADFLYQLPFYTLAGADKLHYFDDFYLEQSLQQAPWLSLLKVAQILTYLLISIRLVQNYRKHLKDTTSSIEAVFHRWLLLFCLALIFPLFSGIVYSFTNATFATTFLIVSFFLVILYALSLLIVKPSLFARFPHQIVTDEPIEISKQKYENSKLQTEQKEKYLQELIAFVEREKIYQSSELTLAELSAKVNIPTHYVSQIINEKLNVNFLDFINGYRVKAAQEMLVDPEWNPYTIVSIAYEAGFNAKSTFYAVFKKHVGMTPSQYRKQASVAS